MGYLYYYPLDDEGNIDNKLKKMVEKEFKKLDKKKHLKLLNELNKINKIGALYIFDKQKQEKNMPHSKKSIVHIEPNLYELRVPKQSRSGVFRVYITIFPDGKRVLILDAEYKTEKTPQRLKEAQKRLNRLRKEADWK